MAIQKRNLHKGEARMVAQKYTPKHCDCGHALRTIEEIRRGTCVRCAKGSAAVDKQIAEALAKIRKGE